MTGAILLVRFLCELAALCALALTAIALLDGPAAVLAAVLLPAAAAVAWGRWVAPRSATRLADPARAGVELVVFGAATAGLAGSGHSPAAVGLAVLAAWSAAASRRAESRDAAPA